MKPWWRSIARRMRFWPSGAGCWSKTHCQVPHETLDGGVLVRRPGLDRDGRVLFHSRDRRVVDEPDRLRSVRAQRLSEPAFHRLSQLCDVVAGPAVLEIAMEHF